MEFDIPNSLRARIKIIQHMLNHCNTSTDRGFSGLNIAVLDNSMHIQIFESFSSFIDIRVSGANSDK